MKYPDWKELENGSLSAAEREAMERLLAEDEGARLDYAAYQEYRMTLRQAVLAESTPESRLAEMLKSAVPVRRSPFRWLMAVPAAAAIVAVALFAPAWFGGDSGPTKIENAVANINQIAAMSTNDPARAAEWVNQSVDFRVPMYRLDGVAKMTGAAYGKDWGAYEFESCGKKLKLIVRRNSYQFKNVHEEKLGSRTLYVGNSVGWKCPSCAYEIVGGDGETRMLVAKAAVKELFGSF